MRTFARSWRVLAAGVLGAVVAGIAAAQHPTLPGSPSPTALPPVLPPPNPLPPAAVPEPPAPLVGPAANPSGKACPAEEASSQGAPVAGVAWEDPPTPIPSRPSWSQAWGERWRRCKCYLQSCFLGFPEEFEEPPLGASVYAQGRTLVANGEAAQMVLYEYDFVECGDQLNPRGLDQLGKIACLLASNHAPVVIDCSLCPPALAQARRLAVINALAQCPVPVPPDRVIIGPALAHPLSGEEAVLIYRNLLSQTAARGGGGAGGAPGASIPVNTGPSSLSVAPGR